MELQLPAAGPGRSSNRPVVGRPCSHLLDLKPKVSLKLGVVSAFLSLALSALLAQPSSAATWYRHPNCTEHCRDSDHKCPSATCTQEWDDCPNGTLQIGEPKRVPDLANCSSNGCSLGGCPEATAQVDYKTCFTPLCPLCQDEKCCFLRQQYTCCELLPCTIAYAGCEVPQQRSLNDSTHSRVDHTNVAHNGTAIFPFYTAAQVAAGGTCEGVRVWGLCICEDGHRAPGCDAFNSSTWYENGALPAGEEQGGQEEGAGQQHGAGQAGPGSAAVPPSPALAPLATLQPGLKLTCMVLPTMPPPEPPPTEPRSPPVPPTAPEGGGAGTAAGDTGGGRQPPPQRQQENQLPPARHEGRTSHGSMVAVIVVGSVLLAACTAGTVLWCFGALPDLHNLRIRSLTTYEPMFTGQSYTPGLHGRGSAASVEDIPWTRFCAAVGEGYRRLRYGKRYRQDRADAAAAAERYRALNSLAQRRSSLGYGQGHHSGGGGDAAAAFAAGEPRGSLLYGGAAGRRRAASGSGGLEAAMDEEDPEIDDVFTLEDLGAKDLGAKDLGAKDLGAKGSQTGGQGPGYLGPGDQGRYHLTGGRAAAVSELPLSVRANSSGGASGVRRPSASAAAATGGTASKVDAGRGSPGAVGGAATSSRPRLNQFAGGGGGGGGGGPLADDDVIHTRQLVLSDGEVGGGEDDDEDLNAPLHLLPTPQVTGQGQASLTRRQAPL